MEPSTPLMLVIALPLILGLLGAVWGQLRGQNREQGESIAKLVAQNTEQESSLARLFERMKAREEAHAQHREDIAAQLAAMNVKLDRLLFGRGVTPPTGGRYGPFTPNEPKGT